MKRSVKVITLCLALTLLVALLCTPAQAATANAKTIVGYGTVGEGVGKQTTVVDFASTGLDGFAPLAGTESVTIGTSAVWQASVLKTHLTSPGSGMGIQKTFADAAFLAGASTLSLQQVAQANHYTVTLRLSGVDKNGAPLVLEAQANATTNHWQTVTFDISAFTSLVQTSAPVTVTLFASSSDAVAVGADWMVKSIYVSTLQGLPELILPIAAALCGLVLGFFLFFIIYRATCKKNRAPRWEEVH